MSDFVATDELATELMDMSLPGYVAKDAATLMHKGLPYVFIITLTIA